MNNAVAIYGLLDPRTDELRYVGKTKRSLRERLDAHMRECHKRERYSRNWLYGLHLAGLRAVIFEIETVSDDNWREAEQFLIAYFRFVGARLTNASAGGDGPSGVVRTPQQRQRMAEAQRGKRLSSEHKAKISTALTGRKMSVEAVKKSSAFRRGRKMGDQTRRRMSEARLRNGTTAAQLEAIKHAHERNRGAKRSNETRSRIADSVREARAADVSNGRNKVIAVLRERGASTVIELAVALKIEKDAVRHILKGLMGKEVTNGTKRKCQATGFTAATIEFSPIVPVSVAAFRESL